MFIVIDQRVSVHKAGIYRSDLRLVDGETGEILRELTDYAVRRSLQSAMSKGLKVALEAAIEMGGLEFAYAPNIGGKEAKYASSRHKVPLIDQNGLDFEFLEDEDVEERDFEYDDAA